VTFQPAGWERGAAVGPKLCIAVFGAPCAPLAARAPPLAPARAPGLGLPAGSVIRYMTEDAKKGVRMEQKAQDELHSIEERSETHPSVELEEYRHQVERRLELIEFRYFLPMPASTNESTQTRVSNKILF